MKLPLLVSVPHAGIQIPPELADINLLTLDQIIKDGDDGAREVFALRDRVAAYVTTEIARAYVDLNRDPTDRSHDGVVKTETIYQEPIYAKPLTETQITQLLQQYYHPYHRLLTEPTRGVVLSIDCHTMAAVAPPITKDPGRERPPICLSDAGETCPPQWTRLMAECLEAAFDCPVAINDPFRGGYIIRAHAGELPWLQLEISRAPFISLAKKHTKVLNAFTKWCKRISQ